MLLDDLQRRLTALPSTPQRDAYLALLAEHGEAALRRDGLPEHVTASTFVLSPDLTRVLLCYHRKGRFWVQFGGHLEPGDASIADAARREAREESGLGDLELLSQEIADLDRHELHGGFACTAHWDVGFVALADPRATTVVSEESEDVAWFAVEDLPAEAAGGLRERLAAAIAFARSQA